MSPEREREHEVSEHVRRVIALGIVVVGLPLLLGTVGTVVIAAAIIGPLITFTLWSVLFVVAIRAKAGVTFMEWFAVMGCAVTLQLLLNLHTRYLGDLVIAGVHVAGAIALWVTGRRARRAR